MKVLFVVNNIFAKGNGLCTSARVTVQNLRNAGIDARFLAGENPDSDGEQPDFRLKRVHVPIFQWLLESNGFCWAHRENDVIKKAVEWADIIHIEEPFWVERRAIEYAEQMNKPIVGTFHLYTQNVMGEMPIPIMGWPTRVYMRLWRKKYFNHCSHLQCPSSEVKRQLEKFDFSAKLHVISNGIRIQDKNIEIRKPEFPPYLLLSTGRFSRIKDQKSLLRAMRFSAHAPEIQLYFAGKGSEEARLKRIAARLVKEGVLKYEPIFDFLPHAELEKLAARSYLYIHTAKLEVEGLGCIEALREGTVPVISKGDMIGTSDFAIDDRSLYPVGDVRELAKKIDWWIDNPDERNRMALEYAAKAKEYDVHNSIAKLIAMYEQAIEENNGRKG